MPWILLLTAGLSACNASDDPTASSHDLLLAQVNGKRITVDGFNRKWSQLPEEGRAAYGAPNGRKAFLDDLINRELLLQKARSLKLDQDRDFMERLEALRERALLDAVLGRLVEETIEVSEEELTTYFNAHRDALPPIEKVRAGHILLKTRSEAEAVLDRLRRGADFSELARNRSDDPGSGSRGGDLGWVRRDQMIPELAEAAFGLKSGRISGIVKTPSGYHIVRIQHRRVEAPRSVNDARKEIRRRIVQEKEAALFEALVKSLRAEATIVISDARLTVPDDDAAQKNDSTSPARR